MVTSAGRRIRERVTIIGCGLAPTIAVLLGLALAWSPPGEVIAGHYTIMEPDGTVRFSAAPPGSGYRRVVLSTLEAPPAAPEAALNDQVYLIAVATRIANHYGFPPELIHALILAESGYDPAARSEDGAQGLMQLMPATAARLGVVDAWVPHQNIEGGVRHLRDLVLQFKRIDLALAAYNAGPKAVIRHGYQVPPYEETRLFVRRVLNYYAELRRAS